MGGDEQPSQKESDAGVVTTKMAPAQPKMILITVDYKPGATYRYTPKQFTGTWTEFDSYSGTDIDHLESAGTGTAYSSLHTTHTQAGCSVAGVGAYWKFNLPPQGLHLKRLNLDNVKYRPCKVTLTVRYQIGARGNQNTIACAYWGPYLWDSWYTQNTVYGNDQLPAKSAVTTTTWEGNVGELFYQTTLRPVVFVGAAVYTKQDSAGAGQASASVFCGCIEFEFP
jgi:hypothetical protein